MNNAYKVGNKTPNLDHLNYTEQAKARKQINVLSIPDLVVADANAAPVLVKKGSLCRILGTAGGWVTFGASTVAVPIITTLGIQTVAEWFYVIATNDYIRTSAAMRVEVTYEN